MMIRRLLHIILLSFLATQTWSAGIEVRHLIVVDTSHSMAARKAATAQMVRDLVADGFKDQLRQGDHFAIWVYNEHNYWNRFPLQPWEPSKAAVTGEVAAQFLMEQNFEGRSEFESAAVDINRLLAVQQTILLNIITDGESPLTGIDYDIEINTAISNYKRRLGPERKEPFLISLLALHGKILSWRIYAGGGEIDLPQVPRFEEPVAKAKKKKTESEETTDNPETEKKLAKAKEKKEEEEKPPVTIEMPPGAKLVMPKPVEIQAPAAPIPAPVVPQAVAQTSTNSQPSTSSNSESKVELAKAQETNLVAAAALNKGNNEGEMSGRPEDQTSKKTAVIIPPRPESSATGPLFYCIAALGFLLPVAAVLLYLQRRANNRGSIISQSLLRDFKSGML